MMVECYLCGEMVRRVRLIPKRHFCTATHLFEYLAFLKSGVPRILWGDTFN